MIEKLNGQHYHDLIDYGIRNLTLHGNIVNAMNVFPVPDGDTGTNMIQTLQNGLSAMSDSAGTLSELSRQFSEAVVFGARGSSGVIVSQFFKGFSEAFYEKETANCTDLVNALEQGVNYAYRSVMDPVEGTVLTVLREATAYVKKEVLEHQRIHTINGVITAFLEQARSSLDNTPNQLPLLRSAGVVDSGGAGIVYVFEGMDKYLRQEPIAALPQEDAPENSVDYTRFNRNFQFLYGYCTELLVQLTCQFGSVEEENLKKYLTTLGDEIMVILSDDKLKLHVHTQTPEKVMAYCHNYGEFLSIKIENMSVQNAMLEAPGIFCRNDSTCGNFAVLAVAFDNEMKDRFLQMGADVVIRARQDMLPSTKDFIEAFQAAKASMLIVFPNSSNILPAAQQAAKLSPSLEVILLDTRSVAECYAALPMVDYDAPSAGDAAKALKPIFENLQVVALHRAVKDSTLDNTEIHCGDYFALDGKHLLGVQQDLSELVAQVAHTVCCRRDWNTVTVFCGKNIPAETADAIGQYLSKQLTYVDVDVISTQYDTFALLLAFE